ncbi:MAG: chemotaxis protein [Rhizobium sp.]|nr:chemotaxis protein [Rhizobium sp.]
MALVKTSELAAKRNAAKAASITPASAAKSVATRRAQDRSRLRQQKAAERIGAATEELASGVTEAAAAAEQLRRALEQIAGGAEEAAGAAHESMSAIGHLSKLFSDARTEAETGRRRTDALQNTVNEVAVQIEASLLATSSNSNRQLASVDIIDRLQKQAEGIGETTLIVADISDRTNLLALNAAIEAARAGQEGRGFSIVADEVRSLAETAERSSRSVRDHAGVIVDGVRTVAEKIRTAAATAQTQSEAGRKIAHELDDIRSSLGTLSESSQSILTAAIQADLATREAQKGSEIVAAAAEEQAAAAAEALRSVEQQSTALDESQQTAHSLAALVDDLLSEARLAERTEDVSSAAEGLSSTVQELSGAAGEILIAIEQIGRGAEAQAAATQQANAAMVQIEKSAAQSHESAAHARQRSEDIIELLRKSRASIETVAHGLSMALGDTQGAIDSLLSLGEIGFQIERTVDRIVLVAVQTSMLALNGSVEAARAGDAGRGFSIVSSDIRKLSQDAAENIDGVKDVVRSIQVQIAVVRRELEVIIIATEAEIVKNRLILDRLTVAENEVTAIARGNTAVLDAAQSILTAAKQVQTGTQQIASVADQASAAALQAATAARQQSRGAEDLAAAVEEIASLADELQVSES